MPNEASHCARLDCMGCSKIERISLACSPRIFLRFGVLGFLFWTFGPGSRQNGKVAASSFIKGADACLYRNVTWRMIPTTGMPGSTGPPLGDRLVTVAR